MKIILFTYLFPNSKEDTRGIFNLSRAQALIRAGHEVCVIAPVSLNPEIKYFWPRPRLWKQIKILSKLKSIPYEESIEGIKTYHPQWIRPPGKFFYKSISDFLYFFSGSKIEKIIKQFEPDLIIGTWLNPFAAYSKYIKEKFNLTFFSLAEGNDVYKLPMQFNGFEFICGIINKYSDATIAVSSGMKKYMLESTILKNVNLIINGYDSTKFFLSNAKQVGKREKFKIVMVALFNPKKGQILLLKALKLIKFPVEVIFIGDGPSFNECNEFVERNKLKDIVKFVGKIPHSEIPSYLSDCDLFCLPSKNEGLPAAPLEAMACGLPVVASNIPGNNEIVKNGFNGYLCTPGSVEDLAEKIMLAFNTAWDSRKISDWVADNFGWDSWAKEILVLYHKYLAKSA